MFSNQVDAIANASAGIGIAIYSKDTTRFITGTEMAEDMTLVTWPQ